MVLSQISHKARMVGLTMAMAAFEVSAAEDPYHFRVPMDRQRASVVENSLEVSPASLMFGATAVGRSTDAQVVMLRNVGTYRLPAMSFSTAGASDFVFDASACQRELEPGDACAVGVSMVPQARGSRGATMVVQYGGASDTSVSFGGTGLEGVLDVSETALTFADTVLTQSSAPRAMSMRNTGDYALRVAEVLSDADDFVTNSGCSDLAPGESCSTTVRFAPSSAGQRTGLIVVKDSTGAVARVSAAGRGIDVVRTMEPSAEVLAFPATVAGTKSSAQTVLFTNSGNLAITPASVEMLPSGTFVTSHTCSRTIEPGESCSVEVAFGPETRGAHNAQIRLVSDAVNSPNVVPVTGAGLMGQLQAVPPASFGSVVLGQTSLLPVTVTNSGDGPVRLVSAVSSSLAYAVDHSGCTTLNPSQSCELSVTFAPTNVGEAAGTLSLAGTAGSSTALPLAGEGLAQTRVLQATPTSIAMGATAVGAASTPKGLTLANKGNTPVKVTGLSITLGSPEFSQTNDCGSELAAGASCQSTIGFSPSARGARAGVLSVVSDSDAGPLNVAIVGSGLQGVASLAPSALDFGSVAQTKSSAAQAIVVTNTGDSPLTVTEVRAPIGFSQSNTCGTALAPGGSCGIQAVFSPTQVQAYSGTLSVSHTGQGGAASVALAGQGEPLYTFSWLAGSWTTPAACGATTATRSVTCQRSDGATAEASSCTGAAPATTLATTDYSGCQYAFRYTAWATPSACGSVTQTRTATCIRTDGAEVAQAFCGTAVLAQTGVDYSACRYNWSYGGWSTPAGCGAVTQTRTASCVRSDGATVSTGCAGTPVTSQAGASYSTCQYNWSYGNWNTPTGCGAVTQTRTATCVRSDGTAVASGCSGTPATSQAGANYAGCTYNWQVGGFSPTQGCGAFTQTRSVSCVRSDGTPAADANCGARPTASQTASDYSACTYRWAALEDWQPYMGGCYIRNVGCIRSDGAQVAQSQCSGTGPAYFITAYNTYIYAPNALVGTGNCD